MFVLTQKVGKWEQMILRLFFKTMKKNYSSPETEIVIMELKAGILDMSQGGEAEALGFDRPLGPERPRAINELIDF